MLHLRLLRLMGSVRLRLASQGLEKTVRWAGNRQAGIGRRHPPERVMRAVQRVGRWLLPGSSCLVQSVTLLSALQAQGRDAKLIIGCGKAQGRWAAHAWVESGAETYQPVYASAQTELARCTAAQNWRLNRATLAG
jgi:Transglutaminase-like superfamily